VAQEPFTGADSATETAVTGPEDGALVAAALPDVPAGRAPSDTRAHSPTARSVDEAVVVTV
jgi:hypothetical protein